MPLLDPLVDARWSALVNTHPDASVFHSLPWLRALRDCYGYQPLVVTTAGAGEPLRNGLVFCRVDSWLTGKRWVSLPFSDHAEPLIEDPSELIPLLAEVETRRKAENLGYVELRPLRAVVREAAYQPSSCAFHQLDLAPSLEALFASLHADSIQRKIRRAGREKLVYSVGRSTVQIGDFYQLLMLTRKRHGIPPQPKSWFEDLARNFGDDLNIRVASRDGRPLAAILTLRHRSTLVYKYGCSDQATHNLGGMQVLMWQAIEDAKQEGLTALDLGRSETSNQGLIVYKDRWGARRSTLTYWRQGGQAAASGDGWKMRFARQVFSRLPASWCSATGQLLYRHMA